MDNHAKDSSPWTAITAPKARVQFRQPTTTSTSTTYKPFRRPCHFQPCRIDDKDRGFQRGKRAANPDWLHSTDQNSPAYGSDNGSSIENAMAVIKQSNETGNITFASINQLSTAMSTLNNQSTAYSSRPTLPVASVAMMPAPPPAQLTESL